MILMVENIVNYLSLILDIQICLFITWLFCLIIAVIIESTLLFPVT